MSTAQPPSEAPQPAGPATGSPASWERIIGRIDRRLVYLGLFLLTLLPLVLKWNLPLYVTPPPQALRDTIEGLPTNQIVFISSNWDAGTQAENRPQLKALVRHLIRRGLKFAVIGINTPNSPQLAQTEIEDAIRAEKAEGRWVYGRDWANLGYKRVNTPWIRAFTRDVPAAVDSDWQGRKFSELPVMQGVHKFGPEGQISAMIDITGSATIETWYQYLTPTKAKLCLGCTAVMAPEQYNYLDSGQLSGLLTGMKGAAEYEQIIGAPGQGMPMMAGQSFAHLYIFIMIVLGNLALLIGWLGRRQARQ